MGTIKKGILGGFSGKVGNVIGANWRGIDVMRSLPKKSGSLPTDKQLEQRARFGIAIAFLSPIKNIIELAYGKAQGFKSKFNLATAYHIQESITGVMPNLFLDYTRVVITKGELLGAKAGTAAVTVANQVDITWENNTGTGLSNDDDQAIVLVYDPVKNLYVYSLADATRIDLAVNVTVPTEFTGDEVQVWMGFLAADGKTAATSVYLGEHTIL